MLPAPLTKQQIATDTKTLQNLATATLDVKGMMCAGCVSAVERQLTQNEGVASAGVNLVTGVAVIKYNPQTVTPETLATKLTSIGFPSQLRTPNQTVSLPSTQQSEKQNQGLLIAAILLFLSTIGHLDHLGFTPLPVLTNIWIHWGLATLTLAFPARNILIDGFRAFWHKIPNMNTLVSLGSLSAYITSTVALLFPQLGWECFFDEPVMLLGFIILGRTLEAKARHRAVAALKALIALQPLSAHLISNPSVAEDSGIDIPVEQLRVGEFVRVLPGEKIPVDGEIIAGNTSVDESLLTGESLPVNKATQDEVIAGSINLTGAIAIKVTRVGKDTTLAAIISSVEDAQTRKAPIQQLADRVAGYFAYGVMAFATLTFLFWYLLGTKIWPNLTMGMSHGVHSLATSGETSPLLLSLKLAIAVLVIACPCALGLATPTAILVGTSIGAERGILIKGGDVLQRVHELDTIVFDKTGTLTIGHPVVTDFVVLQPDFTPQTLLQLAATVESGTNHPLGLGIQQAAQKDNLPLLKGQNFFTIAGIGVSATVEGKRVYLGTIQGLMARGMSIPPEVTEQVKAKTLEGKTVVYLTVDSQLVGLIALQDTLRPDAQVTIKSLQNMGLDVALLTGDNQQVAEAIAQQAGIPRVFAQVVPEEKTFVINFLQQTHHIVAMVGDGINDAPALAQADVGFALSRSTDVARETAGIVLTSDRLKDILTAINLSRATFNKIRQNLFWAMGYNLIAIPIAAGVLLPSYKILLNPALAGGLMAFSSVIVVTNSLLLRNKFNHPENSDILSS